MLPDLLFQSEITTTEIILTYPCKQCKTDSQIISFNNHINNQIYNHKETHQNNIWTNVITEKNFTAYGTTLQNYARKNPNNRAYSSAYS